MVQFFVLQISCNVCIPLWGQCSIGHSRHRADEYGVFLINFTLIWLLSVCIGRTAFNFVSSFLIRSHYAQFNTRLRRWEILIRDTEYVYRAASHFGLTFSTSHVWCVRISAFYEQDCLRSILRWGGLYFRLFISSERTCVWSPFEFV